jgi:8-oxo-dGTP pyrophosphatase MutT (NUDIX family)
MILLLQGCDSGVWSFPKGHPEQEDSGSTLRTAVRETFEETGYTCGRDYRILGDSVRYGKRPYWIGIVNTEKRIRLAHTEHRTAGWFTIDEINQLNTNTDVRAWMKKANGENSSFRKSISSARRLTAPTNSAT